MGFALRRCCRCSSPYRRKRRASPLQPSCMSMWSRRKSRSLSPVPAPKPAIELAPGMEPVKANVPPVPPAETALGDAALTTASLPETPAPAAAEPLPSEAPPPPSVEEIEPAAEFEPVKIEPVSTASQPQPVAPEQEPATQQPEPVTAEVKSYDAGDRPEHDAIDRANFGGRSCRRCCVKERRGNP